VIAKVLPERCQGRSQKVVRLAVDRLNMPTRWTGCDAVGEMYGPLHAQEARRCPTRRSGHTQVRQILILHHLRCDQGKMSSLCPESRP
jgi:hypothetical protein